MVCNFFGDLVLTASGPLLHPAGRCRGGCGMCMPCLDSHRPRSPQLWLSSRFATCLPSASLRQSLCAGAYLRLKASPWARLAGHCTHTCNIYIYICTWQWLGECFQSQPKLCPWRREQVMHAAHCMSVAGNLYIYNTHLHTQLYNTCKNMEPACAAATSFWAKPQTEVFGSLLWETAEELCIRIHTVRLHTFITYLYTFFKARIKQSQRCLFRRVSLQIKEP